MTRMTFEHALRSGQIGEGIIAQWLRRRGFSILPAYEKEIHTGKGPRLFTPSGVRITPDLMAFHKVRLPAFIEAKTKTVFTWHRISGRWMTGIDLPHYEDYVRVQDETGFEVVLMFLHLCSKPDERDAPFCPPTCPVGLFARKLDYLKEHERHRHKNGSLRGMVYWAHEDLNLIGTLEDVLEECTSPLTRVPA